MATTLRTRFQRYGLRGKMLAAVLAMVILGFSVTIFVLSTQASRMQTATSDQYATELARNNASQISERLNQALYAGRHLAAELLGLKQRQMASREVADQLIRSVLEAHPEFTGIGTVWEANAFDGKDSEYAGKPGHDASGRYIPYWNRGNGTVQVEALTDYEKEGAGDYYLVPKKTGQEFLMEPYFYKIAGKDVFMTTIAIPVKDQGKVIGAVTVDLPVASFQDSVSKIRPYETGYATLSSHLGVIIGTADGTLVGKKLSEQSGNQALSEAILQGKDYDDDVYDSQLGTTLSRIYVPVKVGNTTTPWSFGISVPEDKILAGVSQLRRLSLLIGLISVAVVSAMLLAVINRLVLRPLGGEPEVATEIAHQVAQGDLTTLVRLQAGDRHSLMAALASMQQQLRQMVAEIRDSSEFVSDASGEIAKGNLDLSQRTENQAASLAETAASVERMHETVRMNAEHAEKARQLSVSAAGTARQGGQEVEKVVQSMDAITAESRRMADIITTIEGIAFQTNILALNAAVEAARAGEQGRGFAVVASEVRNLAQRSAQASKEIKALIDASVQKVSLGSDAVHQAGNTMHDLLSAVEDLSGIMQEISSASVAQREGIARINQEIGSMDQATQQNAALVEESAAAADSLKDEAHKLWKALSVFKT